MSTDQLPAIYRRPFKLVSEESQSCYIYDANGEMAADFRGEGSYWENGEVFHPVLRARGWGYIQYLPLKSGIGERSGPEAEALFGRWETWLLTTANGSNDPEIVLERINKE